jgi:hypothetical protein
LFCVPVEEGGEVFCCSLVSYSVCMTLILYGVIIWTYRYPGRSASERTLLSYSSSSEVGL